jgi:glyoxylase-like metal-dependent hydrolase (beta-lactamase superfamily II)
MTDGPIARTAGVDVLLEGSVEPGVVSTCTLLRDGPVLAIVDPGMARRQADILEPLAALGIGPEAITDVILSHHHPDHTLNAGLFPAARVHDHWAIYHGDDWTDRDAEGHELSPAIRLIRTPGHSAEDISTVVGTPAGVVVLTHLWWDASGPADDPFAPDPIVLAASRARVLAIADRIVPGHGRAFVPDEATPR